MMMMKTYSQSTDTALSERKKKKLQKRIERLLTNLRHERKNHKLHFELGDLYAGLEDMQHSEKHYIEAIDILHDGPVDEKARKQIIVLYGKILNIDPGNYNAYTRLGEEYVAAGQKEKASRFLLSSGKRAFENEDYDLALQCYQQVIDLGKSNPYIIERCTEIFLKLGRKNDAIENYVKIGDMYAREEKAVEALEYYKKASALDPDSPDLTLKVARMYYTLEWTENAAAEMVKIAEYYELQQNLTEALKYFQHSLSLDRENDRALAGKLRITASQRFEEPAKAEREESPSQEDILEELDLIEEALKNQDFGRVKADSAEAPVSPSSEDIAAEAESEGSHVIDASGIFSNGVNTAESNDDASEVHDIQEEQVESADDEDDFFLLDTASSSNAEAQNEDRQGAEQEAGEVWQDRLLDLNLEENFVLEAGLDEQNDDESPVPASATSEAEATQETDRADEPDTQKFNIAQPLEGGRQTVEEVAQNAELPQHSESGTEKPESVEEPEPESVDMFEFPASFESVEKEDSAFEAAPSANDSTSEDVAEAPLESREFEGLSGQATDRETDRSVLAEDEQNDSLPEEPAAVVSADVERAHEASHLDTEAEKLIEATLNFTLDEASEDPERDVKAEGVTELDDAKPAEAEREEHAKSQVSEQLQENAFEEATAEDTKLGDAPALEREDEMPPTYTAIEKPEPRPRTVFQGSPAELEIKLEDMEKQLENTEEEKYFLQEQFTAQIGKLKSRETLLKREYDRMRKDKQDLQHRLDEVTSIYEGSRHKSDEQDEARYEAIVTKIQRKKQALQEHVNKLLKQREQNGRFLAEELKSLGSTKQRLQNNLEYIQQVKSRVEQKIQTDLRQAQEEVQRLSEQSSKMETELESKHHAEQQLHDRFDRLRHEKETLQDQFTETISALTEENEKVGEQLKELSKEKLENEHLLKKKFKALHLSYQRLRGEFRSAVQSKEMELNRTAQRLSQFADEYVRLETTLKEIRQERDKLERMLVQETATRERLEDNLTNIEGQVDSLEVQGSELLEQLEEELDRQFTLEQSASDEFQGSLGELETLLALQEKEIQSLEVL